MSAVLRATAFLFAAVLLPTPAAAQSPGAWRTVELAAENDLFSVRGRGIPPDYDYTHGTRAAVTWAAAPLALARRTRSAHSCGDASARLAGCAMSRVRVAQDIFTPRRDGPEPVPGERPYAGSLAIAAGVSQLSFGSLRSAELEIGVTGRPSLAEDAQNGIHRLVATGPQLGWRHQLASHGTIALRYSELRHLTVGSAAARTLTARMRWSALAGTARTTLAAGADATLSLAGASPWSPATADVASPPRLYVRLGASEELVVRDAFVQGWRRGTGARARRLVAEGEAAVGARQGRYALEYRQVLRGAEYGAEPSPHPYASVRLSVDAYR